VSDWKSIVQAVAPTIARALGGPLAGTAVAALSQKLLGKPDGSEEELAATVATLPPADLVKLKEAELDFQKSLSAADVEIDRIAAADRANAREREVRAADSFTPRVLAALVVTFTAVIEGYVMLHGLPIGADQLIAGRVLGTLDSATMLVLGYYFGSSASSRQKDETISTIAKTA